MPCYSVTSSQAALARRTSSGKPALREGGALGDGADHEGLSDMVSKAREKAGVGDVRGRKHTRLPLPLTRSSYCPCSQMRQMMMGVGSAPSSGVGAAAGLSSLFGADAGGAGGRDSNAFARGCEATSPLLPLMTRDSTISVRRPR